MKELRKRLVEWTPPPDPNVVMDVDDVEPTATAPEAVVAHDVTPAAAAVLAPVDLPPVPPAATATGAVATPVALPAPVIRWCYCNMDSTKYDENDEDGDMVECTNLNCALKWFHISHIPMIPKKWEPPEDWMCLACSRNA